MTEVFITRSLQQSFIDKAQDNRIKIITQNFIKITPIISDELKANIFSKLRIANLSLLFTSRHAASIAINRYVENIPERIISTWKIYCLSGATKEVLLKKFHPNQIMADAKDANTLIQKINIAELTQPVHFFCGNRRRNTLPDFMKKNSIACNEWVIYRTENTPHLIKDNYQAYAFYSPSAVESFFTKNTISTSKPCFAIGQTTAAALKTQISNPVFISEEPDTMHLLKLLFQYFKIT